MARLNKVCPELPAADVGAAASWYRDKLGFSIERLYPEAGFAIVSRDDIEIHFWTCKERRIAEHTSAYFNVGDVDALHATLSEANEMAAGSARSPTAHGACENSTCGTQMATC